MSSHNDRIAATRQKACVDFTQLTSTNLTTAKHYLGQAAFDLERAVSLFYEAGGAPLPSGEEGEEEAPDEGQPDQTRENTADNTHSDAEGGDPISAILNAARTETPPENAPSATAFGGQGFLLNSPSSPQNNSAGTRDGEASPSAIKVRVTFYRDGFTDQEEKETVEKQQRGASPRRRGVHSFSSSSTSARRVPPKKTYEENAQFIRDVQNSQVPVDYRRRDEQNRPVPVSILLDDQRKRDYPVEMWRKQQQEERSAPSHFGGTGQTLGGSPSDSTPSPTNNNENGIENTNNLAAWLLAVLLSWWGILCELVTCWIRQATAAPLENHVVDRSKATTTIALRMPNNTRERVEFNIEHTVRDLRRYCRLALEGIAEDHLELLAGFPPKTVRPEQDANTLKEAGLLNSAVDVRVLSNPNDKRRN